MSQQTTMRHDEDNALVSNEQDSLGNTIVNPSSSSCSTDLSHLPKSTIHDFPPELLIRIFTYLDPIYLNTLRLVCKQWNHTISDREVWMKSFQMSFNMSINSLSFPTISQSLNWLREYFTRLQVLKNWKKGNSMHKMYQILNNEFRFNDCTKVDFNMNKILIYNTKFNSISMGNLSDGRNQSFIPGNSNMPQLDILCFDINWKYLVTGLRNGEIYLKNLNTSTSVSQRSSTLRFGADNDNDNSAITSMLMNNDIVISGSHGGYLRVWNLQGSLLKEIKLEEMILNISSDFRKYIVVNTRNHIFIIDYATSEILSTKEMGFDMNEFEPDMVLYDYVTKWKNALDVDYGSQKIIICYDSFIRVFNFFDDLVQKELNLANDVKILESRFQVTTSQKLLNRNTNLVGQDGLLYGNLLTDGSIIVWNVRDESRDIVPTIRIYPELNHKKYSNEINHAIARAGHSGVTSFNLNGSVLVVGGFNGLTNVYDIFTGKFLREVSIKFLNKFAHMQHSLVPITTIELNPNQVDNNGAIICGDTVQYFEFGEITGLRQKGSGQRLQKQVNNGSNNKNEHKKKIRDEMDDYHLQIHQRNKTNEMLDKYNGTAYEDEDEEYMMALAISESYHSSREMSINGSSSLPEFYDPGITSGGGFDEEEMDEELRRALELSLIEH